MIETIKNQNFIENLFDDLKIINCKLLFKASENFFSAKLFHDFCDDKGSTLILIKSKKGKCFGGYNPISWKTFDSKEYFTANGAFIFSIDKKTKIPLNSNSAILCNNDIGPEFGHDLVLSDFCDKNFDSSCSLDDIEHFSVEEYEVFSIEIAEIPVREW